MAEVTELEKDWMYLDPTLITTISTIHACRDAVDYFNEQSSKLQTVELDHKLVDELTERIALYFMGPSIAKADVATELRNRLIISEDGNILHVDLQKLGDLYLRILKDPKNWIKNAHIIPLDDRSLSLTVNANIDDPASPLVEAKTHLHKELPARVYQHVTSLLVNDFGPVSKELVREGIIKIQSESDKTNYFIMKGEEAWRKPGDKMTSDFQVEYTRSGRNNLDYHLAYIPKVNRFGFFDLEGKLANFLQDRKYRDTPAFDWIRSELCKRTPEAGAEIVDDMPKIRNECKYLSKALSPENLETKMFQEYIGSKTSHLESLRMPFIFIKDMAAKYGVDPSELQIESITSVDDKVSYMPKLNTDVLKSVLKQAFLKSRKIDTGKVQVSDDAYYTIVYDEGKTNDKPAVTYNISQVYTHRLSDSFEKEKVSAFLEIQNKDNPDNKMLFKFDELFRNGKSSIFLWEYYIRGKILEYHVHIMDTSNRKAFIELPGQIRKFLSSPKNRYETAMLYPQIVNIIGEGY